jgi:hypothetical protein
LSNTAQLKFKTVLVFLIHKNAPRKCLTFWGHCINAKTALFYFK